MGCCLSKQSMLFSENTYFLNQFSLERYLIGSDDVVFSVPEAGFITYSENSVESHTTQRFLVTFLPEISVGVWHCSLRFLNIDPSDSL